MQYNQANKNILSATYIIVGKLVNKMSQQIVVIMDDEEYPFGECDNMELDKNKIMVRKIVCFHHLQKKKLLLKAKTIKSFINPNLIMLQQILVEDCSLHLLFQYVPIKIQTWITNINVEFIECFKTKLIELAEYLAQNSIVIEFKLKNIGMDQNYQPKYFIGLDYQINSTNGKDILLEKYKKEINELFNTYQNPKYSGKITSLKNINLESSNHESKLNKNNQQSFKDNNIKKKIINTHQSNYQNNFFTKSATLNEHDMKLTFNGTHNNIFQNLSNIIQDNNTIENADKKNLGMRNFVQNFGNQQIYRKNDSQPSLQKINKETLDSSYLKFIQKPALRGSEFKINQKQRGFEVQDCEKQKLNQNEGCQVEEITQNFNQQQSPRFGLAFMQIGISNHINDPEKYSFSRKQKRYKTLSQPLPINPFQIHERVNAVILASKRLISNFKTSKQSKKIGTY